VTTRRPQGLKPVIVEALSLARVKLVPFPHVVLGVGWGAVDSATAGPSTRTDDRVRDHLAWSGWQ